MIRPILRAVMLVVALTLQTSVAAHEGPPLDADGCHKDEYDYYHCH